MLQEAKVEKGRILIVDDDPINVGFLVKVLTREGYPIDQAFEGLEGLKKVDDFRPDLILLDIRMPGINGIEFCTRLRADPRHAFRKVLVVSGQALLEERIQAYHAGADDYLVKPYKEQELLAKIRVFLRLKNMEEINQLKTAVLSIFSHETRTPLAVIQGFVALLRGDPEPDREKRSLLLEKIAASTFRLTELVKKTLLLCQLKMGGGPEKSALQPGPIIQSILKDIQTRLQSSALCTVDCPMGTSLLASPAHLEIILRILLENALKFSPDPGQVEIRVTEDQENTTLSIENSGSIDLDFALRIFDEFAVPDILLHHHGSGLSLAIVRNIMEVHGGGARLNLSKPGKVEFILDFPSGKITRK